MAIVCHMSKFKRSDCGGIQVEDNRTSEKINEKNPDLDLDRTKDNMYYNYTQGKLSLDDKSNWNSNIRDNVKRYNKTHDKKLRKDAVVCCSFIIGADKEFIDSLSKKEQIEYFQNSAVYFGNKFGKDNFLGMSIHFDESTPHAHLRIFPELEDGSISAKKMFDRNTLRDIQKELPEYLNKRGFNVERGVEGSDKKHLDELDFKIAKKTEELETLNNACKGVLKGLEELEVYHNSLMESITLNKAYKDALNIMGIKPSNLNQLKSPKVRESIQKYIQDATSNKDFKLPVKTFKKPSHDLER